ncbi:c-type cytochrome [Nitrosococcus watsonii]|uniref:c-type cytochrome n=1 Tax=Nitrosococcus watsonii TaxID=473531 RepID=UPI001E38D6F6|nr:hypothetical protein [Nitrosococcus watsonii]
MPYVFPPVAKSDFMVADKDRAIRTLINGLQGKITVNGVPYDGAMPALKLSNEEVANVLSYVLNSFGNQAGYVRPEDVGRVRAPTIQ